MPGFLSFLAISRKKFEALQHEDGPLKVRPHKELLKDYEEESRSTHSGYGEEPLTEEESDEPMQAAPVADAEPHRADSAKPVVEDDNYFDLLKPAADEQMEQEAGLAGNDGQGQLSEEESKEDQPSLAQAAVDEVPQPATIDEEVPIVIELGPSLAEPLAAPEVSDEDTDDDPGSGDVKSHLAKRRKRLEAQLFAGRRKRKAKDGWPKAPELKVEAMPTAKREMHAKREAGIVKREPGPRVASPSTLVPEGGCRLTDEGDAAESCDSGLLKRRRGGPSTPFRTLRALPFERHPRALAEVGR
ncbi:unnamed protein product [Effrenium voratum]|uniref:Uncharacterized protein n=1 Tax=Effrenium voratum TaxID=2562239 RepID=A0AA36NA16_9DINO|nr:unnamed protein product [Effrenium voratum]